MNLHQKIIAIAKEAAAVGKDGFNQHHKYKYHSHGAVTAAVRDLLIQHGVVTEVSMRDGACVVTLVNAEEPAKERVECALDVPRPNDQPQSAGVIISYAVKVCYQKLFLLEDDSQDAEAVKPKPKPAENFDATLTAIATAKNKDVLDSLARSLDQGAYSKEQWNQLANMYKEKLNAVANSHG
jgi:hypothetical protein